MSKSQQRKGRSGELELIKVLNSHGVPAQPGKAVSIGESPDITGVPGVHVEVKRVERLNVSAAFAQAVRDAEKFRDGKPTLFHRRNREDWLVTMNLKDWIEQYQQKDKLTPCDCCRYNPPSSTDGKACTICPACR